MADRIILTLPDHTQRDFNKGVTGKEVAESIGKRLAQDALCIKVDDEVISLNEPITKNSKIKILTFNDPEGVYAFRHSTCHILADAIRKLYPKAKNTIGPPVDEGFYYDFDELPLTEEDLSKIENEMKNIVQKNDDFKRKETTLDEVKKLFKNNSYKIEMAEDFKNQGKKLTIVQHGDFIDLCGNPHITSTGRIQAFKLTKLAGAYWRGDQKNKQLTRIYGISFPNDKELKAHLELIAEAEKRDHRKLGKELELFMFHDWSPGSVFFFPKGTVILNELTRFLREEYFKRGYSEVFTPQIYNKALWETSGHWSHYKENMFLTEADAQEFSLKPMNCPSHLLMYINRVRSYRELPLRYADFTPLHRNEVRGTLGGLMRVRKFSQDDTHIFCTPEQIQSEILGLINFVKFIYKDTFNFDYHVELSTKPSNALGSEELWVKAEQALIDSLEQASMKYKLNPGDGAFYGPKIDFHIKDCIGRTWQCATIQLDFVQPERFHAEYVDSDGKKHGIVMIHRTIIGSLERFIGILIEHFAGKFPVWLSPVQVVLLTVTDKNDKYANDFAQVLRNHNIRVEVDDRAESIGKKVRDAQLQKIPLIITVGDKEEASETLAVRTLDGQVYFGIKKDDFLKQVWELVSKRSLKIELKKY